MAATMKPYRAFLICKIMSEQLKVTLSAKQQLFLNHIQKGENTFLTGKAGTGKSYVVKAAIDLLTPFGLFYLINFSPIVI